MLACVFLCILQTVAIVVFSALAFSFYVFFAPFLGTRTLKFIVIGVFTPLVVAVFSLYIACTWIDPADPGVRLEKQKDNSKKEVAASGRYGQPMEEPKQTIMDLLANRESGYGTIEESGCKPMSEKLIEKSCCKRKREDEESSLDSQSLYCSICDAEISVQSKHCRACDKCVHGFDHHCRWLNNCVGTRNYKLFVALMVSCLLMLILEWAVGIVVLVRCVKYESAFQEEIRDNLGRSFPRVAFMVVLVLLTFLALLATAPLTQLFFFHLILMHKGITTYDYILAVREQNQEYWDEVGGLSSVTTTPQTSTETGFSGYNSSAPKRIVFCTPPRMFVDQDQTVMALSDLEVGKVGGGKIIDAKSQQRPAPVGLNPWKLARVDRDDAARAAARAREKSSILRPVRPGVDPSASIDSDSSLQSSLSSSGEIRVAGSRRSRKKRNVPGLRREMWSITKNKWDRIIPLSGEEDLFAPRSEGLQPLSQEPTSPYRSSPNEAYSGAPRASFPPPASYPPRVLFPRYPGDAMPSNHALPGSDNSRVTQGIPHTSKPDKALTELSVNSVDVLRISANSDGYEASCGESGDDTSDAVGLSQSWNNASWSKFSMNNPAYATPVVMVPVWGQENFKEESAKPWVVFSASSFKQDVKESPGGQSASSGSRVEANILKMKPELRDARKHTSSPTVYEDSPLRESSDFLSEDTTTSYGETPDRGSMSSFFYNGPLDVSFKAPSERHMVSNRRLMNSIMQGPRLSRPTDDPKLLVETP
uniref:S-acyltransferase n=1 Tax=Physcomitrium patens TaxID=3218 RepID=A0A7I4BF87_PHYPA